jgi:hypothetical protein
MMLLHATCGVGVAGLEKGSSLVAAAGGEVLLLEHMDYRGTIPADGGAPITCLLALTKASYSCAWAAAGWPAA